MIPLLSRSEGLQCGGSRGRLHLLGLTLRAAERDVGARAKLAAEARALSGGGGGGSGDGWGGGSGGSAAAGMY